MDFNMSNILSYSLINLFDRHSTRDVHTTASVNFKDYYEILSVPRNASLKEIKSAYYDKAKAHHPDTNRNSSTAVKFQEISEAYEILSDKAKRRAYDTTTGHDRSHRTHMYQNDVRPPIRKTTNEPINMNHIHHVYRTLNREDEPKNAYYNDDTSNFRGRERRWDADTRAWVYNKGPSERKFTYKKQQGLRIVKLCVTVIALGTLLNLFNYNYFLKNIANQSMKRTEDIARDRAGMYVIRNDDPK